MIDIKALGHIDIRGTIVLLSGLHIGAGKETIEIGGIDNAVIRHPHTGEPYIPGSSLKGKLRFLLEWAFDKIRDDGKPWGAEESQFLPSESADIGDPILRIFGSPLKREKWQGGPTRLIMRDAPLNEIWRQEAEKKGLDLTEEKTEVVIDRLAGKALDGVGPRRTERVPAGARFDFACTFRVYSVGNDGGRRDFECLNWLLAGLALLEKDALGGSGSRGYGRIRFEGLTIEDWTKEPKSLDNEFRCPFDAKKAPRIFNPDHLLSKMTS
jgi:CRISPR-associated protein Csm3